MPEPRYSYPSAKLFAGVRGIQAKTQVGTSSKVIISDQQAVHWLTRYPVKIIDESLDISCSWFRKNAGKTDIEFIKYASVVMRNKFQEWELFQQVHMEKMKAEWAEMTDAQRKEYLNEFRNYMYDPS